MNLRGHKDKKYRLIVQPLRAVETDTHKLCLHCNKTKLKSEFSTRGAYTNRLSSNCKECVRLKHKLKYNSIKDVSK